MKTVDKIANEIRNAYEIGFWGGGSIRHLLRSFNAFQAASYPIPNAHSVWEIVLHLTAWHIIFSYRIMNKKTVFHYDDDWPNPDPINEQNWSFSLTRLDDSTNNLVETVRKMNDKDLELIVPGKEFTYYEMLHGIPQHDQYHAGQVMFLKKLIK